MKLYRLYLPTIKKNIYLAICSDADAPEFVISIPIAILAIMFIFPMFKEQIFIGSIISIVSGILAGLAASLLLALFLKPFIISKIEE